MVAKKTKKRDQLVILVSSSVYGFEELLDRIYAILTNFGYDVWMSHKGTMPVWPDMTAFENCLRVVEECDLFLGIITPRYGSGKDENDPYSISHQELLHAIELNKPRWILAHDHVSFARLLLNNLGYKTTVKRKSLSLKENSVLDDLRVIDMYEAAIRHDLKVYRNRKGNWVQKFNTNQEAQLFATAQFYRYQEIESFIREHFNNSSIVSSLVNKGDN